MAPSLISQNITVLILFQHRLEITNWSSIILEGTILGKITYVENYHYIEQPDGFIGMVEKINTILLVF